MSTIRRYSLFGTVFCALVLVSFPMFATGAKEAVKGEQATAAKAQEGSGITVYPTLAEYEKAPEITKVRLYLESMEEIFAQVQEKIVIDESVRGMLPLLHLGAGDTGLTGAGSVAGERKGGVR